MSAGDDAAPAATRLPTAAGSDGASISREDEGRAEFYALLARLWYASPDQALLSAIVAADEIVGAGEQTALAESWRELQAAAAVIAPEGAAREYESLFVGTGKAEITLYASHYVTETAKERVLVALRDELCELGLARADDVHEPEDHFAALCEIMRHLIVSDASDAALQRQRKFFTRFISPAYNPLVEQVFISGDAGLYRSVARLTKAFLDLEAAALEML